MLNEGIILNDSSALMKSEIVRQIRKLGRATPDELERSVFESLTGGTREDVDWDVEDNKAGYYLWVKTFDGLVTELVEDGHVKTSESDDGGSQLEAAETDPDIEYGHLVYPPKS